METLKILITGASGFIGSNIVRHLLKENYEVYGGSRSSEITWRLRDISKEFVYIANDITEYKSLRDTIEKVKPDGIVNCAQYGAYAFEKKISDIYNINVSGLFNLLEISSEFNINFLINSGTSFEYSGSANKISEDAQAKPVSNYGVFKAAGTNLLSLYSNIKKMKLVTLRVFQAYGPYEAKGRLAPYVLCALLRNEPIRLNNPSLKRDFVYVKDIASAVEKSIKSMDRFQVHEIFNIGSGKSTSIKDFVLTGKKVLNSNSEIIFGNIAGKPEDNVSQLIADNTKATNIMGWNPDYDISNGIKDFSAWMKERIDYYK